MARLHCLACDGVYGSVQADGAAYYHVCPSLSLGELQAAVDAGVVVLPDGETPAQAINRRVYVRADHRDENVTGPPPAPDQPSPIKAEGAGVEELIDEVAIDQTVTVDMQLVRNHLPPTV